MNTPPSSQPVTGEGERNYRTVPAAKVVKRKRANVISDGRETLVCQDGRVYLFAGERGFVPTSGFERGARVRIYDGLGPDDVILAELRKIFDWSWDYVASTPRSFIPYLRLLVMALRYGFSREQLGVPEGFEIPPEAHETGRSTGTWTIPR